tara:strand:+ start:398 stop:1114 length:717 start_codon:yes stop_codon:yes gene_type:complete
MGIKQIIAIASAKGGVGKSTICANLALQFSAHHKVGILDADIYGPNQHIIFNVTNQKPKVKTIDGKKIFVPIEVDNILLNSMGFVIDADKAAMWRGPMLSGAIKQLKNLTQWGYLDYLFVDMPPGTGDAYLTVASDIKPDHALLITTMSKLAVHDTLKSKAMFDRLNIPIIGIIDNMSHSICSKTKNQIHEFSQINLEQEIGCDLLGSIPRHEDLADFDITKKNNLFETIYNKLKAKL